MGSTQERQVWLSRSWGGTYAVYRAFSSIPRNRALLWLSLLLMDPRRFHRRLPACCRKAGALLMRVCVCVWEKSAHANGVSIDAPAQQCSTGTTHAHQATMCLLALQWCQQINQVLCRLSSKVAAWLLKICGPANAVLGLSLLCVTRCTSKAPIPSLASALWTRTFRRPNCCICSSIGQITEV